MLTRVHIVAAMNCAWSDGCAEGGKRGRRKGCMVPVICGSHHAESCSRRNNSFVCVRFVHGSLPTRSGCLRNFAKRRTHLVVVDLGRLVYAHGLKELLRLRPGYMRLQPWARRKYARTTVEKEAGVLDYFSVRIDQDHQRFITGSGSTGLFTTFMAQFGLYWSTFPE